MKSRIFFAGAAHKNCSAAHGTYAAVRLPRRTAPSEKEAWLDIHYHCFLITWYLRCSSRRTFRDICSESVPAYQAA